MKIIFALLLPVLFFSCSSDKKEKRQIETEVLAEAYEYGFPLVLMDMTRRVSTNVEKLDPATIRAPKNQFVHANKFPDSNFRDFVRPNVDTLYSMAWLDLSKEPMVLEVPDTNGRYYLMPFLDGWTNVYESPGKRTTGTKKNAFLIVGPNWTAELPSNFTVIRAPTNMTWIVGRTKTNNVQDAQKTVTKIQEGYKLYPMSAYGKDYTPLTGSVDKKQKMTAPVEQVLAMSTEDFFNRLNELMVSNPPSGADQAALSKFSKYDIGPGMKFVLNAANPKEFDRMKRLPDRMKNKFAKESENLSKPENGWMLIRNVGSYGTDYHKRALIAYAGLGANLDADTLYPTTFLDRNGQKLDGKNNYTIHFAKEEIPKVKGFWSLTVYGADGFLVANSMNRFSLGDRDKLTYNKDGSLDIYLQNTSPGKNLESNWLPTPQGNFNVAARFYWPEEYMLSGAWTMPPIMPRTGPNISLK